MNPYPPHAAPTPVRPTASSFSIASLVLGILGFCSGITTLPAVVCGHIGLSRARRSKGQVGGTGLAIAGLITGYIGLFGWLILGGLMVIGYRTEVEEERQAGRLFDVAGVPVPRLPDRPPLMTLEESGTGVTIGSTRIESGSGPGESMDVWIYLPAGEHADGSLPAVLVAAAGTNLLSGYDLGSPDETSYHDECLPYAEAGMAVITFSLDGAIAPEDEEDDLAITEAYEAFREACAGVVNARNALEFALARLPEIDPARIYSAGHSSAGTLSLLLAAHEPRLAGSVAYAPATDVASGLKELIENPFVEFSFPSLESFAKRSSPLTHVGAIDTPVFLFHAEGDGTVPVSDSRTFASKLEELGGEVELMVVPGGDHYDSMIAEGIPAGIEWIRRQ